MEDKNCVVFCRQIDHNAKGIDKYAIIDYNKENSHVLEEIMEILKFVFFFFKLNSFSKIKIYFKSNKKEKILIK